jgi:hypothetical protein
MTVKRKFIGYYLKNGRVLKAYLKYNNKTKKYSKTRYSASNTQLVKGTRVYKKKSTVPKQKSKFGTPLTPVKSNKPIYETHSDQKRADALKIIYDLQEKPETRSIARQLFQERNSIKPQVYDDRCTDCSISEGYKKRCIMTMLETLFTRITEMYDYNIHIFKDIFINNNDLLDIKNLKQTNINILLQQNDYNFKDLIYRFNIIIKSFNKQKKQYNKSYMNDNKTLTKDNRGNSVLKKDLWKIFTGHLHRASELIKHIRKCLNTDIDQENIYQQNY